MKQLSTMLFSVMCFLLSAVPAHAVSLSPVASGFDSPLFVTHAGDGSGRLFVVEQGGLIRIVHSDEVNSTPFLDVRSVVSTGGERGLLGLAFHPQFESNHRFFISYTDSAGSLVVAEYRVSGDNPDVANQVAVKRILRVRHPNFSNHNGGMLAFGPGGLLYIGTGDGGSVGDPNGNAQRLNVLNGKILRININRGSRYVVPRKNPFVKRRGARGEIFAFGLRNPWRFSFDRSTGRLFAGDVGQGAVEEVDIITRGSNYGWNIREGSQCYKPSSGCSSRGLRAPISEYSHNEGQSITGGYVYRGPSVAELSGRYLFGDFASGKVWTLTRVGDQWQRDDLLDTGRSISSFGEDQQGEVYLVDYSGAILRFVA